MFGGIEYDEYGRAFCAAHGRPECHICCMSFTEMNDEIDENPSDRDVGVFVSEDSLVDWHAKMKAKMPQVFSEDDKVFGNDPGHHPYGTKLLTYFGDDKDKPMHCTVLGSRWKKDGFQGFPGMQSATYVDGREPMYTILINGELSQIELMDAHMAEGGGWAVVGRDSTVNARYDALARAHQNGPGAHSDEDEDSISDSSAEGFVNVAELTLEARNRYIRRTLKSLHEGNMKPWEQSEHGIFLAQFFMFNFSSQERDHIMTFGGHTDNGMLDSDNIAQKLKAFHIAKTHLQSEQKNFYARVVMAQMVAYFFQDRYGAFILENARRTKFQAIEFNQCHASHDAVPCVNITYATDPEGDENPKLYLRGEKIKTLGVSNELAVTLEDHLLNCVSSEGLNDLGSGLLYHEGYLVPMEFIPLEKSNSVAMDSTHSSIPDINFGVELELSCASGNYQQRMASSIAKHAQIDVKIRRPCGKGGKGDRKGGFGFSHQKSPPSKDGWKGKDGRDKSARHNKWKLVYDRSIQPNSQNPHSTMFELVSPILNGNQGLRQLSNTVVVTSDITCVRTNKSMGTHVHVEAKNFSLESMKCICQHFLRFEDVVDSFLPFHRRTGSEKCHSYFESNLLSVMSMHDTLKGSLKAISCCQTPNELYDMMNPGIRERYHKLNLQNLRTGRQPTIEFRQHHASKDENEIVAWVRFCVLFVVNVAKLQPVLGDISDATFDELFGDIISCPTLREYYSKKKVYYAAVNGDGDGEEESTSSGAPALLPPSPSSSSTASSG